MTHIIDFLQHKDARQEAQIERYFTKSNSLDERLDTLLAQKHLQLEDHKLFLAF